MSKVHGPKGGPKKHGHGHGHGPMMMGDKPKHFKKTLKNLMVYLKPYKFRIIFVFLLAIVSTMFSIVSPTILGDATDVIVSGVMQGTGVDFPELTKILVFLISLYLISFGFSIGQGILMSDVAQKVCYKLRDDMSSKLDRLPIKFFDTKTHGEVQSRIINDIETVNQTLSQSLTQFITSTTTIIGILIMMLRISPLMTLTALIVLPLSTVVIKVVVSKSQVQFIKQQKSIGELNSHVEEMITGHNVVKAFNREEDSIETFTKISQDVRNSAFKSQFLSGLMMPITAFIGNIGYVAVCVLGGHLALKGRVSIGDIQAFIQYVRSFNQPISQVANIVNLLQSTAAAAERVLEVINTEDEVDAFGVTEGKMPLDIENAKGEVTFKDVTFGYKEGEPVIKNFNFHTDAGKTIAIVGKTGAGKTTLVKLLLRFYELTCGEILVDGVNINSYARNELRDLFGMVLQDTWLFKGTIMENIKYGNVDATDEQVVEACKAAHIHHFIMTQPGGYNMVIGEDASNISQGQKQLITIARAMVADNPIMILDEATSSVDTRTEKAIQNAMDNLMAGRTSFVIAHRLSTIKDADTILVIDNGDIVEQGNHQQLLELGGYYSQLYNSQFEE